MPKLEITNFNIVVSVLGGWISPMVSYPTLQGEFLSPKLVSHIMSTREPPAVVARRKDGDVGCSIYVLTSRP